MIYSISQLMFIFCKFNEEYFDGCLPMPKFEIIHSFKYFGYFSTFICENTTLNPVIKISDNYDYTESQLRDIFVHEMIHYYLAYTGKDVVCTHGIEFHTKSNEFNVKYGMNITDTIDMTLFKRRKGTSWIKYIWCKLF